MGRKQSNIIDFVMKTMKQILLVPNQWVLVLNVRRMPEFNYLAPIEIVGEPYDYGLEGATYAIVPAPSGD